MKQYTGKTLDDVLNTITSSCGCELKDVTYEVISEEKHLFGIGNSVTVEAYTPNDIKEFIFDYLGAYFTELNQGVSIEIIIEKQADETNLYRVVLDAENNAIIIGKNGNMIKEIGIRARKDIEEYFGKKVYLDLFVKVIPKWRDKEKFLNMIGYKDFLNK